jgi:tetratricopeptide (TPR) repeat protein
MDLAALRAGAAGSLGILQRAMAPESELLLLAGALCLALAAVALWRRLGARTGGERRARTLRDTGKALREVLRARLAEPALPFADGGVAGPMLGVSEGFERDVEGAAGACVEAGGSRAKARQILRDQLEHAAAEDAAAEPHRWRQLAALALIDDEEAARKSYARAADLEPERAETQMLLGILCLRAGKLDAAEAAFRRHLQLEGANGAAGYRGLAMLGEVCAARGAFQEALELHRKAHDEVQDCWAREPASVELCRHVAITADRVGDMQVALGDLDAALASYRLGLKGTELLLARDCANPEHQRDLSISHERVGETLKAKGELELALASFRQGLAVAKALAGAHPDCLEWRWDLSASHDRVGDALAALGRTEEALACYRQGLSIAEDVAAHGAANLQWQRDLAASYHKAGAIEAERHNAGEARALLEKGRAIIARLERIAAYGAQWRADLDCFDRTLRTLGP